MNDITTLALRSEVPVEQTWDLASVYATPADWDAACAELAAQLPELAAFRGRLAEGPATLLAFLEPMQAAGVLLGKITIYAYNGSSVDTGDQAAAARAGQARTLMANFAAAVAFFDPELMAIGLDTVQTWIDETPDLAFFCTRSSVSLSATTSKSLANLLRTRSRQSTARKDPCASLPISCL